MGDPLVVRGSGYDDEDGPLSETSLNWFVVTPGILWPLTGTGSRFDLRGYPPGDYSILLSAADSDNNTGLALAQLTIAPKYIAEASEVMKLDGYGDDAGYAGDRNPLELRYSNGDLAIVRMVRSGDKLFVCASGLPIGLNPRQFIAVCADANHSGDMALQADDWRFQVYLDGTVQTLHGDGSTFVAEAAPVGLQARVSTAATTWTAELSIDLARLGGWNGQTNGLSIGHYHRNYSGDDTLWPLGGIWNVPGTWGACVLGPNPNDLADADQDRMPDQWEIAMFGTTKRDGQGDFDHDGMSDLAEYIAGTDPRDPLSRLEVRLQPASKGGYQMLWSSVPGRSYTVYRSTDLRNFVPVATAIPAQGTSTSWLDSWPPTGQVFYRVQAQYWR